MNDSRTCYAPRYLANCARCGKEMRKSRAVAIDILNAKAELGVCNEYAACFHNAAKMLELLPAADVTPVRHDLRAAVEVLGTYYERGLNSNYVRDPIAWALYQTWRKMDGGADNG